MAAVMSPIMVGTPSVKLAGVINSGGFIYTYVAGTTTPANTWTTNTLGVLNSNPIVLNSYGLAPSEIWWNSGSLFKFIVTDSVGNVIGTYDDLVGINDAGSAADSEWIALSVTPTYVSATSFTVQGNQTSILQPLRRIKSTNTGGVIYSTILTSSYSVGTGLTTVVVINDSGVLDSGLSSISYSLLSATNPSVPTSAMSEWILYGAAPTYVSAASFTVVGNQTTTLHLGRRVRTVNTGGTYYGTILSSTYSAPDTTVTVVLDSGALDAGLSSVSYGLISRTNTSVNGDLLGSNTISAAVTTSFDNLLTSAYRAYEIVINCTVGTDQSDIGLRFGTGSTPTYQATNYQYGKFINTTSTSGASAGSDAASDNITTRIVLSTPSAGAASIGNAAGENFSAMIRIYNPTSAVNFKTCTWEAAYINSSGTQTMVTGSGAWLDATAITSARLLANGAVTMTGTAQLYGIR